MKKIAVIGGSSGGLCTARHLLDSKLCSVFEPVILEQKNCSGGTWAYEDYDMNQPKKEVYSSMHQNLRLVFYPASIYLLKVKNGANRAIWGEICSKLTKALEQLQQWKHQNNV